MSPESKRYPCALYYPGSYAVVGGNGLGFHRQPHTTLVVTQSWIGLDVHLPRQKGHSIYFTQSEGQTGHQVITMRLPFGSFDLEKRYLRDDEFETLFPSSQKNDVVVLKISVAPLHDPIVDGVGLPFKGETEELTKLASNLEISKVLTQIVCQDRFNVLVNSHVAESVCPLLDRNSACPQPVTSEDPHHWDLDRYQSQVPQGMGKTQDSVKWGFDSPEQVRNILTRSVAQDVWWFAEDVHAIRKCVLPFRFVKKKKRPDAFGVTVVLDEQFCTRFERSLKSLIRPGASLFVSFRPPPKPGARRADYSEDKDDMNWAAKFCKKTHLPKDLQPPLLLSLDVFRPSDPQAPAFRERDFDLTISSSAHDSNGVQPAYLCFYDGIALARRRIEAVNEVFGTDDGEDANAREETATDSQWMHNLERGHNYKVSRSLMQDFFLGRGFGRTILNHDFQNFTSEDSRSAILPKFDLIGRVDADYLKAALSTLDPGFGESFEQYAKLASLGIFTICGSGDEYHTNEVLAFTTLMFLQHQETRKIHAAASTHQSARKIAARVYCMTSEVLKVIKRPNNEDSLPLVVRGYNIDTEVSMFINEVSKKVIVEEMTPWEQSYSLCEWLQKVVKARDYNLNARDHPGLFELRRQFETAHKYRGLRAFVKGKIRFSQIKSGRNGMSGEQQDDFDSDDDGDDDADMSHEGIRRRTAKLKAQVLPKKLLKGLMKAIVREADVICTTTHLSRDKTYESFRQSAGAIVLCDAGTMSRAEAMVVWGGKLRPCAIGGSVYSRTRTFIDAEAVDEEGNYLNRLAPDAQISILDWAKETGHPRF